MTKFNYMDFSSFARRYSTVGDGVECYVGPIHRFIFGRIFDKQGIMHPVLEVQTETRHPDMSNNKTVLQTIRRIEEQLGGNRKGYELYLPAIKEGSAADLHGASSVFIVGDVSKAVASFKSYGLWGEYVVDELHKVAEALALRPEALPLTRRQELNRQHNFPEMRPS